MVTHRDPSNGPEDRTPPTGRLDHHTQLTCGWSSRPATLEVRLGGHNFGTTKTGYLRADFHDAWSRYLPPEVGNKGNGATVPPELRRTDRALHLRQGVVVDLSHAVIVGRVLRSLLQDVLFRVARQLRLAAVDDVATVQ
jgi:hypothetical protein